MNWYIFGFCVAVIVLLIALVVIGLVTTDKAFKNMVYQLVLAAENAIVGTKLGQARLDLVVSQLNEILPKELKFILTGKRVRKVIEWAVVKLKETYEENIKENEVEGDI